MNLLMLEKLLDVSRKMAETRLLDPLLEYAMSVALDLCNGEKGYLVLIGENGELEFRVRQDKDGNRLAAPEGQISRTIFREVIETRQPRVVADAVIDPSYRDAESVVSLRLRSVMCAPLIARESVLGALYIENRANKSIFDQDDLRAMEYFAAQTAVSIENALLNDELEARVAQRTIELKQVVAQLEMHKQELIDANVRLAEEIYERERTQEELQKLATTDWLTGVFNRRHFFDLGDLAFHWAKRQHHMLAALMIDVDHFKRINDQHGHAVGDQVLQALAVRLLGCTRSGDILARYGGEEFVVLMPQTDLEKAMQLAEHMRLEVVALPVATSSGDLPVAISVGVSTLIAEQDHKIDAMVDRADQALYQAKQAGRNCVMCWENRQH
ncbi:MAG: diguanylate cyclase [Chloroflexota bacterium]